jgi:hypothetical protein
VTLADAGRRFDDEDTRNVVVAGLRQRRADAIEQSHLLGARDGTVGEM